MTTTRLFFSLVLAGVVLLIIVALAFKIEVKATTTAITPTTTEEPCVTYYDPDIEMWRCK